MTGFGSGIINKAGIMGLGLIGGSMARALRVKCGVKEVVAVSRNEEALKAALDDGALTGYSLSGNHILADCDIVFICLPVDKIAEAAAALKGVVKRGCLVTDCGSVKYPIVRQFEDWDDFSFIGGHPMAGSEKTGYAASSPTLFENAYYILTPFPNTPKDKMAVLESLTRQMGAIPIVMNPAEHDSAVAAISHAPHVIASALVNASASLDANGQLRALAAGGFKDITRIASADPGLWREICMGNREQVMAAISSFKYQIQAFENALSAENGKDLETLFAQAREYRDNIPGGASDYGKLHRLYTDIDDKPGTLANVAVVLSSNNINIKDIGIVNNREQEGGVLQISFDSGESKAKAAALLRSLHFTIYEK